MTRCAPGITFPAISRDSRRRRNPRRAQLEIEVHRTGQPDRAKHVGKYVSRHARRPCAGRAGIRFGRTSRSVVTCRRAARQIGRSLMALTRGPHRSVGTCRRDDAPADFERISR